MRTKYLESLNLLLRTTQAGIIRSRKNDVPVWMKRREKEEEKKCQMRACI